jgi:phosphotransferase system HPr-like phosphotransfer protein
MELELEARGPDADAMLRALAELVAANFGEE